MNLKQIECFRALAKTLNFSKAAEELFISQSAFSRIIASLEEELGCLLLIRSKTQPKLTEAGQQIFECCNTIQTEVAKIEQIARRSTEDVDSCYTIGTLPGGLQAEERDLLKYFNLERPSLMIHIRDYNENDLLHALETAKIDCAFFTGKRFHELENFEILTINRKNLLFICGKEHPLANRRMVNLSELKNEKFGIMRVEKNKFFTTYINELCVSAGFLPNISVQTDSIFSLVDYIEADLAVSLMFEHVLRLTGKDVVGIQIVDTPQYEQMLLLRKDDHRKFTDELRKYVMQFRNS